MPIVPDAVTDELIVESWGDSVAAALNSMTGLVLPFAGSSAPSGWLLCDGSSQLRSAYADLFAVIGTTYGAVDGTHFTLPDLRGRFPLGRAAAGTGSTLGATGGALGHTHTGAAHTHTGPSHTHTGGSHAHELPLQVGANMRTAGAEFGTGGSVTATRNSNTVVDTTSFSRALSENVSAGTTGASGTAASGSTSPGSSGTADAPFLALHYIIRT